MHEFLDHFFILCQFSLFVLSGEAEQSCLRYKYKSLNRKYLCESVFYVDINVVDDQLYLRCSVELKRLVEEKISP